MKPIALCALLLVASCDKSKSPTPRTTKESPAVESNRTPRPFIDSHTHVNPFAYKAFFATIEPIGVRRIINLSGGSSEIARTENLAAAARYGDRVMLFYNVNWEGIDAPDFGAREAAQLEEAVRAGFAGLKVSKALGLGVRTADGNLVPVDDPRLDPLWAKAGELGVPVAIHTSDPKAFFEPPTPDNERWAELSLAPNWSFYGDQFPSRDALLAARDRMVKKHPNTTFILLHLGNNPEDPEYIDAVLDKNPNAVVDVAARIGEFGRHDAVAMRKFFIKHAERVLFGTDMMMRVYPGPLGRAELRLTLGSVSDPPADLDDIAPFYAKHFSYFESDAAAIEHPVPIQGDWKVHPVRLPDDVLDKLYFGNTERIVAAPWLARRAARHVAEVASSSGP